MMSRFRSGLWASSARILSPWFGILFATSAWRFWGQDQIIAVLAGIKVLIGLLQPIVCSIKDFHAGAKVKMMEATAEEYGL